MCQVCQREYEDPENRRFHARGSYEEITTRSGPAQDARIQELYPW
ncbi:MAG: hypothetical protein ACXW3E_13110 [Thermoanaerobaculia bacterium]